ncbi:hypothetical protein SAMN05446935_9971 [Burkholderia sp. YR290]|nr:hypothetical protein SAMN05446935_9971 [Burkholderia sp. YR290]
MKKRKLGTSGLEVSAIGFGCMGLDFSYAHKLTKEENIAAANVELTPTDLAALAAIDIEGERCPANLMATTGL